MIKKINLHTVHREVLRSPSGEAFSSSAVLSDPFGFDDVFVHHEILPPGRRASKTHAHTRREELCIVMRGTVVARCGGAEVTLEAGDVVGFGPGEENAHHLRNDSTTEAHLLVVASNPRGDEVVFVDR